MGNPAKRAARKCYWPVLAALCLLAAIPLTSLIVVHRELNAYSLSGYSYSELHAKVLVPFAALTLALVAGFAPSRLLVKHWPRGGKWLAFALGGAVFFAVELPVERMIAGTQNVYCQGAK